MRVVKDIALALDDLTEWGARIVAPGIRPYPWLNIHRRESLKMEFRKI